MSAPKLELAGLCVTYRGASGTLIEAVRDLSLKVEDKPGIGEILVLLGPSGCGKSSILKTVAGLQKPTRGQVLCDGEPVSGTSALRGMVFQQYTSFPWLTVRRNVEYGLRLAGVAAAERRKASQAVLERVGLDQFADELPKSLSGGMRQRVAIARTLVNKPRFLLMDEPFGALDPQTRWEMQSLLLDISRTEDNTIVFVTHDVTEAVYLGDSIVVLSPRPAQIVQRVDVPFFADRSPAIKASSEFRKTEETVLKLLVGARG